MQKRQEFSYTRQQAMQSYDLWEKTKWVLKYEAIITSIYKLQYNKKKCRENPEVFLSWGLKDQSMKKGK